MKVAIINGQNHKGTSYNMGRIFAEMLTDKENITEFFLPKDLNHFCLGCYTCLEDKTKCPFWSEKQLIINAMEEADVLVLTTPNYCMAPSGSMKAFLDMMFDAWMPHRPYDWMFKKRAMIVSCSAGASCKKAIRPIKDSLFFWGVPYIKTLGLSVQAMNFEGVNDKRKELIHKKLTKIAEKFKTEKQPYVGLKTRFIFKVMGLMHKSGWDSSPCEKEYWQERGWIGKNRPWKSEKH